jgi:uncharacterized protein (DUF697 family)
MRLISRWSVRTVVPVAGLAAIILAVNPVSFAEAVTVSPDSATTFVTGGDGGILTVAYKAR